MFKAALYWPVAVGFNRTVNRTGPAAFENVTTTAISANGVANLKSVDRPWRSTGRENQMNLRLTKIIDRARMRIPPAM